MDASHASESFRSLLLRYRGRTGLIQRDLAARAGVSRRAVQEWEAGDKFPSAERLQALIRALLESGGMSPGREALEARELWAAAERDSSRMRTPFDDEWFATLVATYVPSVPAGPSLEGPGSDGARTAPPRGPLRLGALADTASGEGRRAQDWGEAPDTIDFVGRVAELALLRRWVLDERSRVVAVLGIGGIGKTSLAARLAQNVAPSFQRVHWRSLRNAPPVSDWLAGAISFLSDQALIPPATESERITALVHILRARRCLVVLDNSEALFEAGLRESRYRAGMAGYGQVLAAFGETSHQSCLILTSREAPPELAVLADNVRNFELNGFSTEEAQALLAEKQLIGNPQAWLSLVARYDGNGLALKIVSETIRGVYGGDIAAFLADATTRYGTVFGGIRRLLDGQAERLSPIEREILTRLAVERVPISLAQLSTDMDPSGGRNTLVEAIETLRRRSLVERGEPGATFTLQSMVLEYVTDRLVESVVDEIRHGEPMVLLEQPLIKAQAKDYVREAQERVIGVPIIQRLNERDAHTETEARLLKLLDRWRDRPSAEQGYGPGNVVNLLRLLRGDLRQMDLSRLTLRQVYLQGVDAQDASLACTHLTEAVVDEAFPYAMSVALSADGALLAAGTPTGEFHLWRAADRTPLLTAPGHTGMIFSVALSEDGRLAASASFDGTVRLWDSSGQPLATLRGHTGGVWSVALSAKGTVLASGGVDGIVRLWAPASARIAGGDPGPKRMRPQNGAPSAPHEWQLVGSLPGHMGVVWGVALAADGRTVATGDDSGSVRLWDAATGQLRFTLQGHAGAVWGVSLTEDGKLVASGGIDGTVRLWAGESGNLLATLQGHTGGVRSIGLSGDGRLMASGGADGMVRVWDSQRRELLATLRGHTGLVIDAALSRDGRLVASASMDGTLRLWEAGTGQLLATMQGHTGVVWGVSLSADGKFVAGGCLDGTVRVWDTQGGQLLATLQGHTGLVRDVALSGDGRLTISGGADGTVRLWETRGGQLVATLRGHSGTVWCVAVSRDGRLIASGGVDATVRAWATRTGQLLATLQGHAAMIWSVSLSEDGRLVASGSLDGTVRLWETGSGRPICSLEHPTGAYGVSLSGDGGVVASGAADGTVRVWGAASNAVVPGDTGAERMQRTGQSTAAAPTEWQLLTTFQGHAGVVYGVALSRDGELVASSAADGCVKLWEARTGKLVGTTLLRHDGPVYSVALSADGRLAASGGDDGRVRLSETKTGAALYALRSDRHYQRMDIAGLTGVTDAQRAAMLALGATEHSAESSDVLTIAR